MPKEKQLGLFNLTFGYYLLTVEYMENIYKQNHSRNIYSIDDAYRKYIVRESCTYIVYLTVKSALNMFLYNFDNHVPKVLYFSISHEDRI